MTDEFDRRQYFFDVWNKSQNEEKLNQVEKQVQKMIEMHPEYHGVLSNPAEYADREFTTAEPDPFAHLGLHSIVVEMIASDHPPGIRSIYDRCVSEIGDKHEVQHEFMEVIFDWMIEMADDDSAELGDDELLERFKERFRDDFYDDLGV